MISTKGATMKRSFVSTFFLIALACTVNVYDYSTHSGSEHYKPDTVYVEQKPPETSLIPDEPDTVFSRRPLLGPGAVEIIEFGNWKRHTLTGCVSETDGAFLEIKPVVVYTTSSNGSVSKTFEIEFHCRLQPFMVHSEQLEAGAVSSASGVLPVVTGDELLRLVTGPTTLPFLEGESDSYEWSRLQDGTFQYVGVYSVADWKMRLICTAERMVAVSDDPEFNLIFGDDSRRLFQQFYDIFVIHHGDAPILPVMGGASRTTD